MDRRPVNSLVSICIPTFNRPVLLRQAIESCLIQSHRNIEILISDDSQDEATCEMVQRLDRCDVIRYSRNIPALRQPRNVNRLFELARGEQLILLHDDDLLMPDAVESLLCCFSEQPELAAAFGKQYVIDMAGAVLSRESDALNERYQRTPTRAGLQHSSLWSALVGQFPNDGYMIRATAARQVGYRDDPHVVGDFCDYDFGLRLAQAFEGFYFVDRHTAKYRLTDTSISRSNLRADLTYRMIESLAIPAELEPTREQLLREQASAAINSSVQLGAKREAWRIYFSTSHPWSRRVSARGLCQAILLAAPTRLSKPLLGALKRRRK